MRVLYVNWIDHADPMQRGGGVAQYERNLSKELAQSPLYHANFLSCGTQYDLRPRPPYYKQSGDGRFTLVNSGVLAPAHASFGTKEQLDHPATEAAFYTFLYETGPYDVVHFNNLEGLPATVLNLKQHFARTQVIFTLHNYYPFCPQVNLWHQERAHCADNHAGANCTQCLPYAWPKSTRRAYGLASWARHLGLPTGKRIVDMARRFVLQRENKPFAPIATAEHFRTRRAIMIAALSACDAVLCVSERVNQIAQSFGVPAEKLRTHQIGTPHAAHYSARQPQPLLRPDGTLHMAYLGYMRRDKGFYFLLGALSSLPAEHAKRLHLTVAARRADAQTMSCLNDLRQTLGALHYYDGYTPAELGAILNGVTIGVSPALWEDNLPQTALEMHARRIPLLCSTRGGAQELGNAPAFTFEAGNTLQFHARIAAIFDKNLTSQIYWEHATKPQTMREHMMDLSQFYHANGVVSDVNLS